MHKFFPLIFPALATSVLAQATTRADSARLTSGVAAGLKLRSIGPALTSGRVADVAVHPTDKAIWYVAAAAGGVWKTTNAGTSFTPVFDGEGSFSIGAITIDQETRMSCGLARREQRPARCRVRRRRLKSIDGGKS
jgi:hypothetical protein